MIEIMPMDADGTQVFKVNGITRYGIYTLDSLRGTRYGVYPASHIGREYVLADLDEAFAAAMDEIERIVEGEEMLARAQR